MVLPMTRYAEKILNYINESYSHPTAEEIFFALKKTEPKIVLASVYNNLNMLTDKGLIRKVSIEGQTDRYDKIKKHDHIVCGICGKLADFEFGDLTENLEKQLHSDIFKYDLKVYYECPECRNKKQK